MRLTDKAKEKELKAKKKITEEEEIYLKLAQLENEFEAKTLFTKAQLNKAIMSGVEMFGNIVKIRATEGILMTLLNEIKGKEISYELVEKTALEIIKEVAR